MCEKEKVTIETNSLDMKNLIRMTWIVLFAGFYMTWVDVFTKSTSSYRITVEGILISFGMYGIFKLKLKEWF